MRRNLWLLIYLVGESMSLPLADLFEKVASLVPSGQADWESRLEEFANARLLCFSGPPNAQTTAAVQRDDFARQMAVKRILQ